MNFRSFFLSLPVASLLTTGALAEPAAPAAPKAEVAPPEVTFKPFRTYQGGGSAGPFEPDKAARNAVSGVAVIECNVALSGDLTTCSVIAESPQDYGFGPAALMMVRSHAIHAPAAVVAAAPTGPIRLTVPFTLPEGHTSPVNLAYFQGMDAFAKGQFDVATQDFTRAVSLRPDFGTGYIKRGLAYDATGQKDLALQDIERAINLRSKHAEADNADYALAYYYRAGVRAAKGELEPAILDYGEAIKLAPNYRDAVLDRGVTYDALGQYDRAIEDDSQAIKLKPDADAYSNRAAAQLHAGKLDAAAADYSQAIAIDPKNAQAYLGRAAVSFRRGDYERAIADFDLATINDPKLEPAFQSRCLTRAITGKALGMALADCDRAIALQPNSAAVLGIRSLVQFRLNHFDLAVADGDAALARQPGVARTLYVRGLAKRKLGDGKGADADAAAASAIDSGIADRFKSYGLTP